MFLKEETLILNQLLKFWGNKQLHLPFPPLADLQTINQSANAAWRSKDDGCKAETTWASATARCQDLSVLWKGVGCASLINELICSCFFHPRIDIDGLPIGKIRTSFLVACCCFHSFFFLYDIGGKKYLLIIWRHILKFKKKNHQQEGKVTELEAMEKEMVNSSMGVSRMVRVRMMASEGQLVWTCPEHDLQRHHLTDAEVGN